MSPPRRSRVLVKAAVALAALAAIAYLFMWSLASTRSEPYVVDRALVANWTLMLDASRGSTAPLLSLATERELVSRLFSQLFKRSMESMSTPSSASIPVVLRGEFDRSLAGGMTPEALIAAAREAGVEGAAPMLRCLAHRRISAPGDTRQVYFVVVDAPAIVAFRERLASSAPGFDAAALTPMMFVGATDAAFDRWLPLRAGDGDCVAPVRLEP
jgi:hypothetical protein